MRRRKIATAIMIALALGAWPFSPGRALGQQAPPETEGRGLAATAAETMTELRMVLGSVTDTASAEAAGPPLRELRARLEALTPRIGAAGPQDRAMLAEIAARDMASVRALAERAIELPGTEMLRPDIEAAMAQLSAWGG